AAVEAETAAAIKEKIRQNQAMGRQKHKKQDHRSESTLRPLEDSDDGGRLMDEDE
ncbi:hypothetical protein FRC11_006004, partial [Ceratobasidium sp. 423]